LEALHLMYVNAYVRFDWFRAFLYKITNLAQSNHDNEDIFHFLWYLCIFHLKRL